jgi:hypothetical protein
VQSPMILPRSNAVIRSICLAVALATVLTGSRASTAAVICDNSYSGPANGNWNVAGSWTQGHVPTTSEAACIPAGKGTIKVVNGDTMLPKNLSAQSAVEVDNGGILEMFDGSAGFTSNLTELTVKSGGIFETIGSKVVFTGDVVIDGTLQCAVRLDSGTLSGSGQLFSVDNVAGTVRPGGQNGIGTLTFGGPFVQEAGGILELEIASDVSYDKLSAPSSVSSIAGAIHVTLLSGYVPPVGTDFFFFAQNATSVTITAPVTPVEFALTVLAHGAKVTYSPAVTTTTTSTTTTTTSTTTTTTSTTTTSTTTTSSSTTTTTSSTTTTTSSTTTTTSSTTTTTTSSTTTSTRPTTTTTTSTTTTTTTPAGCDAPRAATFTSIECRLDALIAQVTAASDIPDHLGSVFLKQLDVGRTLVATAKQSSTAGGNRKVLGTLQHARRKMINFSHRVRSLTGRRGIPQETANDIAGQGDDLSADLKTLRTLCTKSTAAECGAP